MLATVALLTSGEAGAQIDTEAFGVVDLGLRIQAGMLTVSNGGLTSSRLGLHGLEQLNEDVGAGYWLETGVVADTGALSDPSRLLSRRSTLSLQSRALGELRMGRDFSPTFQAYSPYDVFGVNGIASFYAFIPTGFVDNQVSYFSPAGHALQIQLASGAPEAGGKLLGMRMRYANNAWDGSLGYQRQQGANTISVVALGYPARGTRWTGIYGRTEIGPSTLSAYQLGAQIPLEGGQLRAAIAVGGGVQQFALGCVAPLSSRTSLYATFKAAHEGSGAEMGVRHMF